jgi:hypothetical protein
MLLDQILSEASMIRLEAGGSFMLVAPSIMLLVQIRSEKKDLVNYDYNKYELELISVFDVFMYVTIRMKNQL